MKSKIPDGDVASLMTFAGGAVVERFDEALREVLADIRDPNKKPDAKRAINVKVIFDPDAKRAGKKSDVNIEVTTKLGPEHPMETVIFSQVQRGGELIPREHYQKEFSDDDEESEEESDAPASNVNNLKAVNEEK